MGRRDDDEFEVEGTGTRQVKHQIAGRASLTLPQGLSLWKPKKSGSHTIDLIPFKVTENVQRFHPDLRYAREGKWYHERTFFVHGGIGVNDETYTCLARTFGKPCPICEARAEYNKSPNKEDEQMAYDLRSKERQLFLVFDHDDTDKGLQLWEIAYFNFGKQLDQYIDGARKQDKEAYSRFYHPTDGYEMRITGVESSMGEGQGKNTVYSVHQFYKRDKELPRELFNHGFDLDGMIRELDYDTLKKIYVGVAEEEEPDNKEPDRKAERPPDDEPPRRETKSAPKAEEKPTPKPEPKREEPKKPEPTPKDPVDFGSKDRVRFDYRGTIMEGVIEKVDKERAIAYVPIEGREKPCILDFDELTLVEADSTFDAKPPAKKAEVNGTPKDEEPPVKKTKAPSRDDEWDDGPPRKK